MFAHGPGLGVALQDIRLFKGTSGSHSVSHWFVYLVEKTAGLKVDQDAE